MTKRKKRSVEPVPGARSRRWTRNKNYGTYKAARGVLFNELTVFALAAECLEGGDVMGEEEKRL